MRLNIAILLFASLAAATAQQSSAPTESDLLIQQMEQKCKLSSAGSDLGKLDAAKACIHTYREAEANKQEMDRILLGLTNQDAEQIRSKCKIQEADTDPVKLKMAMECLQTEYRRQEAAEAAQKSIQQDLNAIKNSLGPPASFSPEAGAEPTNPETATHPPISAPASESSPVAGTEQTGQQISSSAYTTPSACARSSGFNHPEVIGVRRELLAPKEASDVYGRRLGRRYFIYQVRVSNYSKDFQYVVHDITVNMKDIVLSQGRLSATQPDQAYLASTRDLTLLRGIPEKGQDLDPRNLTLHILQGVGSVAGGVSGLTAFSDVMGSAVAVFNGAFLQAFVGIAPDHTATQLNRLSDEAFTSNTLVDKLHTKVFAIFVPEALVLDTKEQNTFWGQPAKMLGAIPLDTVDVCVDGSLVTNVDTTPSPVFSEAGPNVALNGTLTITDSDPKAVIFYTVDGVDPTSNSTKYTAPIAVGALNATHTIRAIAIAPNQASSAVSSMTYTVREKAPSPSGTPGSGSQPAPFTLQLTLPAGQTGLSLLYTTDGSNPLTSTTVKKSQENLSVQITAPATVTAVATGPNNAPSEPLVLKYTK
jgi:hypothetical protein